MSLVLRREMQNDRVVDFAKRMWQGKNLENLVKLGEGKCCTEFRRNPRQSLGVKEELSDECETTSQMARETTGKAFVVFSGKRFEEKET